MLLRLKQTFLRFLRKEIFLKQISEGIETPLQPTEIIN